MVQKNPRYMWQSFHVYASFTSDNLTYFSKLNPKSSYSQVQLHERWLLVLKEGHYEFLVMPFGFVHCFISGRGDYQIVIVGQESSLIIKPSKCYFGQVQIEYLGHIMYHKNALLLRVSCPICPNQVNGDWGCLGTLFL